MAICGREPRSDRRVGAPFASLVIAEAYVGGTFCRREGAWRFAAAGDSAQQTGLPDRDTCRSHLATPFRPMET